MQQAVSAKIIIGLKVSQLVKIEYEALKSLVKDKNIIVQKSDKGNSVVILNKEEACWKY